MEIKVLEDVATSDLAFEVKGDSPEEVFEGCALALTNAMVNPSTLCSSEHRRITLKGRNMEELLFDWLSEIVYLKDAERVIFKEYNVDIECGSDGCLLSAECRGCEINNKVELRNDIKAITLHMFSLHKEKDGWLARVIADL